MNFFFNDSTRRKKSFITVFQPAQGTQGKGCAPFPIHRGYRHYLRLYFLTRLLPTHANSCFLFASCNRL